MFLIAKFQRSDTTSSELANIVGVHRETVYRWVSGKARPQKRYVPVLRKMGLWGTETFSEPVASPTPRLSIKERLNNLRALEAARISDAVENIRKEFKGRYVSLQNECSHNTSVWSSKQADQGLVYINSCADCSKELGRE